MGVIRTEGLVKSFGGRRIVDGVSIEMRTGEVVGLLGPNGAGKTTTFYMVIGLVTPDEGQVSIDDTVITRWPMYRRARLGLGYLPQEPSIFKRMTVEDNILALWELTNVVPKPQRAARLDELLHELRVSHIRHAKGVSLSGGERRRVEILRALALNPSFILLDEPFAGIDPIAVHDIQGIIQALTQQNIGVIITDHSVRETLAIVDRAYILHSGKVLLSGNAQDIAADASARELYLGRDFSL